MSIEYRTAAGGVSGDGQSLDGLVTPFGVETTIGDPKAGGFREQIAPGAFTKTLQERDVVLLFNHNTDMPLARTSAGNLSLHQADDGLRAEATPVETSYGKDLLALTRAGVVKGMSFGFEVVKDDWTDDDGRSSNPMTGTRRTIREVRLHEVSAVTFPAYESTTLSARDTVNAARGTEEDRANPKPYGDVKYADPKNGKYPVDTEAHAKAAWAYINVPKNADQYPLNGVTLESVKSAIKAALHHFGVEISEDERSAEDVAVNHANKCSMCGQDIPGSTPDNPGPDGDGDSDADDQKISRATEPVETTPDEPEDAEYRAWLESAIASYLATR